MRLSPAVLAVLCCAAAPAQPRSAAMEIALDKPAQHRAGIRTVLAQAAPEPLRLPGKVVADPRRELRVAAAQDGVIELAGPALPLAGQAVRAGQVLAWLRPVLPQPERRDLEVELSNAHRDLQLGRMQIDRYGIDENQHLEVKLPTPSIEILTGYRGAQARQAQLSLALSHPVALTAPRDGTILRSAAVAGRVAAAGQTLFELDAPRALAVEVEYGDAAVDPATARQALTQDGRTLALRLLGASYDAALRSHRALYALEEQAALRLAVNQPVLALAQRGAAGLTLPAEAVSVHDGAASVWLHQDGPHFVRRDVELAGNDGVTARVTAGLRDGERVVVQGRAALDAAAAP